MRAVTTMAAKAAARAMSANSSLAMPPWVGLDAEAEELEGSCSSRRNAKAGGAAATSVSREIVRPARTVPIWRKCLIVCFPSVATERVGVAASGLRMEGAAPRSLQERLEHLADISRCGVQAEAVHDAGRRAN
jgi:hypothetical protein